MREVSPASSSGLMAPRTDAIPRTTSYAAESSPEPNDPFLFGPATPEYHYQDAFMAGYDGSQSPNYSDTGSLPNGWSHDNQMMFGARPDVLHPLPQFSPAPPQFTGHARSTSLQSQPEAFTQMEGLHSPPIQGPLFLNMIDPAFAANKLSCSPPPLAPAPLPTPPASAMLQNHDCTRFAFQTLNSLYSPPSSQNSTNGFDGTPVPTLDNVLSTNKAAVDKLYVLLECSCSINPHFSTTIAFAIIKILSWYQAIAGAHDQDFLINTQMESFIHSPISLGDFRLEVEDEHTFRTQLVLAELRKVEKLIDKFSERYCKSADATETGIDGSIYGSLEQLLRTRVRDTFRVTMRTAPEDVKRQVASRSSQHSLRVNSV